MSQRGSVMSFFSFSFMGAGPIGALLWGFIAEYIGPQTALFVACTLMFAIVACLTFYAKRRGVKFN